VKGATELKDAAIEAERHERELFAFSAFGAD
jgi:hypothetical protein